MADNAQKVRDIIEKELGVEREKLTDEASFIEDLGADSLDIVELVMEFEKEFNIDIPDEDAEKLRTVGDAVGYLNTKMASSVMKRRVVVTGMGAITPVGNDVATTWRAIIDGRVRRARRSRSSIASHVPGALRLRGEGLRSAHVHGAEGSEARRPVRAVRHRRVGAGDDATPGFDDGRRLRSGAHRRDHRQRHRRPEDVRGAARRLSRARARARSAPFFIPMFISDIAAGLVSMRFNAKGPNYATSRPAPRARTRSATRSARSSTATPTS